LTPSGLLMEGTESNRRRQPFQGCALPLSRSRRTGGQSSSSAAVCLVAIQRIKCGRRVRRSCVNLRLEYDLVLAAQELTPASTDQNCVRKIGQALHSTLTLFRRGNRPETRHIANWRVRSVRATNADEVEMLWRMQWRTSIRLVEMKWATKVAGIPLPSVVLAIFTNSDARHPVRDHVITPPVVQRRSGQHRRETRLSGCGPQRYSCGVILSRCRYSLRPVRC
jgi:hypothetical protein